MFIIKLSQHVSGIIMPIIRRTVVCTAAYGVLHCWWWLWLCGAGMQAVCTVKVTVRLHSAVCKYTHFFHKCTQVHTIVLLMMGIMMPKTCWDSLIINIRLVASCWFLSLHPMLLLNLEKTYFLQFLTKNTNATDLHISCENRQISSIHSTKFWGLVIDDNLSRHCHIDQMIPKLNKASYIIRSLK